MKKNKKTIWTKQIVNFVQVNEHYGYHKNYPEITFLYLHKYQFTLENIDCIYGGKIISYGICYN